MAAFKMPGSRVELDTPASSGQRSTAELARRIFIKQYYTKLLIRSTPSFYPFLIFIINPSRTDVSVKTFEFFCGKTAGKFFESSLDRLLGVDVKHHREFQHQKEQVADAVVKFFFVPQNNFSDCPLIRQMLNDVPNLV